MITVEQVTKKYGSKTVLDDVSFSVRPGVVTGFLGPNGAGKSTTLRIIVGLDHSNHGRATIDGKGPTEIAHPMHAFGALLDAGQVHPSRSARNHLRTIAASNGISDARVSECLAMVGLTDAAKRKVGGFSLGMRQRLGLAAAMLGDPKVIMLDEPANGLDPEGVHWIRAFLSSLAAEGRTVFVSSHLLSEMELMADDLVIIGAGRVLAQTTVADFKANSTTSTVAVRTERLGEFASLLASAGAQISPQPNGDVSVTGWTAEQVGKLAFEHHFAVQQLTTVQGSLEAAFLQLTDSTVEYRTGATPNSGPPDGPPTAIASTEGRPS